MPRMILRSPLSEANLLAAVKAAVTDWRDSSRPIALRAEGVTGFDCSEESGGRLRLEPRNMRVAPRAGLYVEGRVEVHADPDVPSGSILIAEVGARSSAWFYPWGVNAALGVLLLYDGLSDGNLISMFIVWVFVASVFLGIAYWNMTSQAERLWPGLQQLLVRVATDAGQSD